ncbi:MAG: hypothetical protein ACLFO3_05385 [Candidatus Acetothermia bacterium]
MQNRPLLHPFLFAIYPVLLLFTQNITHARLSATIVPLIATLTMAGALLGLLNWKIKDLPKAAVLTSISLAFFFSYGFIHRGVKILIPVGHGYLLSIFCLVYAAIVYLILRKSGPLNTLTRFLNIVITTLIGISLLTVTQPIFSLASFQSAVEYQPKEAITSERAGEGTTKRDIYYIVLERYGAAETLEEVYGFDNKEFLAYLEDKGFYVASRSRANYLKTGHSLASSLNMQYINYLSDEVKMTDNWRPTFEMLKDHKVQEFLKDQGYEFIHFGGWWEPTRTNEYADLSSSFGAISEFSASLAKITAAYPILSFLKLGPFSRYANYGREIEKLDRLTNIAERKKPTFTFVHSFVTHEPFLVDREGQFLPEKKAGHRSEEEKYIEAVQFVNGKLRTVIEELLSSYDANENHPIIIIQADEGPPPKRYREDEKHFDWREASKEELQEKMRILNAYYLPALEESPLYSSITPVNSFRLIFKEYFNVEIDLLPDKSYIFRDGKNIYDFYDVTEQIQYQEDQVN